MLAGPVCRRQLGLKQAPEERRRRPGGAQLATNIIPHIPFGLSFPSSHLPPPGLLGGPRGQLPMSLKIAQPALGVKEPLLLTESQRPGRWRLVSVTPPSLRDQILLFTCQPSSSPNLRFTMHCPLCPSVSQGLLHRGSHSGQLCPGAQKIIIIAMIIIIVNS